MRGVIEITCDPSLGEADRQRRIDSDASIDHRVVEHAAKPVTLRFIEDDVRTLASAHVDRRERSQCLAQQRRANAWPQRHGAAFTIAPQPNLSRGKYVVGSSHVESVKLHIPEAHHPEL